MRTATLRTDPVPPRVAAIAPQRPQRERVLAAAVEADHILGLREVPLEREARVLAAQGDWHMDLQMALRFSRCVVYRLCRGSSPSTT